MWDEFPIFSFIFLLNQINFNSIVNSILKLLFFNLHHTRLKPILKNHHQYLKRYLQPKPIKIKKSKVSKLQ